MRYHILLICFFTAINLYAEGKLVTVQLKSDSVLTGELISVNKNGIIISLKEGLTEEELSDSLYLLCEIRCKNIAQISFEENSQVATKVVIGTLLGIASGWLIVEIGFPGSAEKNSFWNNWKSFLKLVSAGLFGVIGLVVGTVSGIFESSEEINFSIMSDENIKLLKSYARYTDNEPEFINRILPE